ncbi:aldo/keto reductase [Candidatus Lucifugimonas marina]|uniref:Aldo/keto reductase n=1 Tax=Candidatus Lucifugimonas marina TaxID=3038979 RepID=A0AAJ5ZG76_9CHLR|nr:aldo/keto reductase [SAR202 cluster bacterium JH702]MDG0870792.1 aldo/keto reductase [SAR202 cluster bacterium JH639]WFG36487.1 aldo/keto reductase [SAR202 cluster bacterium JH545]WFG40420.1 aldo/keto reductase [SAR202 cluster bacterium JH1073]
MGIEYVNFGTAGVKVSPMALGLGFRGQFDRNQGERVIHTALDSGINLIDCANVYGWMDDRRNIGSSEQVLGKALKGRRDDVVITSKVFSPIGSGPNDQGPSRYHVLREIERSLTRLDTDHVDVYIFHGVDDMSLFEEQFRAMETLVQQGKTRYVGVSNFQAWQVMQALDVQKRINAQPLIAVQNPYSLMNRTQEDELFPMVRETGVGIMAYSPLGVGLLSGTYKADEVPDESTLWGSKRKGTIGKYMQGRAGKVIAAIDEVAGDLGVSMPQVAMAWVMSHPEVTVAISGADTVDQMKDVAGALDLKLPAEAITKLDEVSYGMRAVLDGNPSDVADDIE